MFSARKAAVTAGLLGALGTGMALMPMQVLAAEVESLEAGDVVLEQTTSEDASADALVAEVSEEEGDKAVVAVEPSSVEETGGQELDVPAATDETGADEAADAGVADETTGVVDDATDDAVDTGDATDAPAAEDATDDQTPADEPVIDTEDSDVVDAVDPAGDSATGEDVSIAEAAKPEGAVADEATYRDQWVKQSDSTYYYYNADGNRQTSGWVITTKRIDGTSGSGERYWIDKETGALAFFSKLLTIDENDSSYYSYATDKGYVVRGKYTTDLGLVYLANNDGRLENAGWLVSSSYGDGTQRYYIDSETHACKPGYSADGWDHYTRPEGYVARGKYTASNGTVYLANNDGKLETPGWHVSSDYGDGLQRYYVDSTTHGCNPGYSEDGWAHYTTSKGYVLRGSMTAADGSMYYANNDGKLVQNGWIVTDSFGQGLQRYWIANGTVLKNSFFDSLDGFWGYATSNGSVLRSKLTISDQLYMADNDGKLAKGAGWLISSAYGDGLQRYWLTAVNPGYSYTTRGLIQTASNAWAYGTDKGYVVRGKYVAPSTKYVYLADNDGKLEHTGWVISSKYSKALTRYYIDEDAHACIPGFSSKGWAHYTNDDGSTLVGKKSTSNGFLLADGDGRLAESYTQSAGFYTTSKFDKSSQTYYLVKASDGHLYAKTGRIDANGNHYYGRTDTGYILKGKLHVGKGMLLADSNGVLAWKEGWIVTDIYDNGVKQRYRIDSSPGNGLMGAHIGLFSIGGDSFYGREDQGYVVIGTGKDDDIIYITPANIVYRADSVGRLNVKGISYSAFKTQRNIQIFSSGTRYLIAVDVDNTRCMVFEGAMNNWTLKFDWLCTTGAPWEHEGQGTPRGVNYYIGGDGSCYNWALGGGGGYRTEYYSYFNVSYFTCFMLDLGFHSVKLDFPEEEQLGRRLSQGCVRLSVNNAKWIYENALPGTRVITF